MSEHVLPRSVGFVPSLKHLSLAMKYSADSWFPASPDLVSSIRNRIVQGVYERECDALLGDIKQDHALVTYFMKEFLPSTPIVPSSEVSPIDVLREVGYQRISESLCRKGLSYSVHSLRTASREQIGRIAHSVIATGTSELLSEARSIPMDLGYSTSLLRQLGLSLITWNYPHVYSRAINSLKPGDSVEDKVARVLGFSPSTLALKLTSEWFLSPALRFAMGDSGAMRQLDSDTLKNFAINLSQVCAVGEALARAHDPQHYPSASDDWELARQEITAALGSRGMREIASWILAHCTAYESVVGSLFPATETSIFIPSEAGDDEGPSVYDICEPPLREALDEFGDSLDETAVSNTSLQLLLQRVIPAGGFDRGCVYLVDPGTHSLFPRIPVGDVKIERFKPIDYLSGTEGGSPILTAFHAQMPIIERDVKSGDRAISYYAAYLGGGPRIGVLYLEVSEARARQLHPETLDAHFEAIREAFNAILIK